MKWIIKRVMPELTTWDGVHYEYEESEIEIPFDCCETVYYVHRKKWWKKNSLWVVTKSKVIGVWATNVVGVTLKDNTHLCENEFDLLFKDKADAIEFCLKKNEHRKVKIYGE
jgi:hypothetical protein